MEIRVVHCIEVTVIFVICFIFACIVHCGATINLMQNKLDVIQQFIVSLRVYLLSIVHAQTHVFPNKSGKHVTIG